ncbi:LysR family transcriptional regulator [Achromobacter aloeverae]|uniref:LysR family transcriptional regulator n=1 Tax=Achromobacter aloeverae TaxID=1750518 RepID=A0A4V1MS64_9BURK|nr:LysR family transcriptional regulator [Achromobacter aloeverae]RXN90222.1 LysR family transcriptional regulator [Achromobacter aloeverae]
MQVFVRVAECGSFSRGAESLNLANATVTISVRNLEKYLGVPLIVRGTRKLRLTEEGELYLIRSKALLAAHMAAEDEVRHRVGALAGPLHVESPITFGHVVLAPALPLFSKRYPNIEVVLTLTNEPHDLAERGIDVAIRMEQVENETLIARPYFEANHIICCTRQTARALPSHPRDVDPALCLGTLPKDRRSSYAWQLRKGTEALEIQPRGPLHFNSSEAVLIAARQGAGLGYVLDIFARQDLASGTLVQAYPDWSLPARPFYLATSKQRWHAAKVRAFIEFLSELVPAPRRPRRGSAISVRKFGDRSA